MNPKTRAYLSILAAFPVYLQAQAPIVLAAEDDWYPYAAKVGTVPRGFSVELITAAFEAAGSKVTYKVVPFARAMEGVKDGTYAGCFNAGTYAVLRSDYLVPVQFLALSEQVVWGRVSDSSVKSYKDLEGKTVGIVNAYTYSPLLTENDRIRKDVAPYEVGSLKKVSLGRIDYTIVDRWVARSLISSNAPDLEGKVKALGTLQTDTIIPVFSKKHADGARALKLYEEGMKRIRKNGTYDRIMAAWDAKFRKPSKRKAP